MKLEPYKSSPVLQKLQFSDRYCKDLLFKFKLSNTSRRSAQVELSETELKLCRSEVSLKIAASNVPIENILNWDESGWYPMAQKHEGYRDNCTPYKLDYEKLRFFQILNILHILKILKIL